MRDNQLIAEGFFYNHNQQLRKSLDEETLKNFISLNDDLSRVAFFKNLPQVTGFDPSIVVQEGPTSVKNVDRARVMKSDGNNAVQAGNWLEALAFYTKGYLYMPNENVSELSIIIANRSAALYHLQQYELALIDIDVSLSFGYPQELKYKIFDRRAKCYLALKWNREAIIALREMIQVLDSAKLPKEQIDKKQIDARLMIEILEKSLDMVNKKNKNTIKENVPKAKKEIVPFSIDHMNRTYKSASDALSVEFNESDGRYVVATKNIEVGETVVVEKAHCSVLLAEFSKTHCQHCFTKCLAPVVCISCVNVIFCSQECRNSAMDSYHKYECPILRVLWASGCSITCHMALRIILQRDLSYFTDLKTKLNDTVKKKYSHDDYQRVYNLVGHENMRSNTDRFHRTHMSVFLLNLLKTTDYFSADKSDETETYIGSLILRNLQILQFNAHEIFELSCEISGNKAIRRDLGKTVFLGGGLYPTLALFNHSCDPGVVRYFQGTSVIVKAIKGIQKSQQVAENYGPIFTRKEIKERKSELKDQYWFECHCTACEEKWPTFEEMEEGVIRFKCSSEVECKNIIKIPANCEEFLMKCDACQQFTNILKGLKALQDTEQAQRIGKDYMEKSDYKKALSKFTEELKIYEETLAPPFKDYHLCQQNIRRCLLTFGNCSIK